MIDIVSLLITLLLASHNLPVAETIYNADVDYYTTIDGIQSPLWEEANPIGVMIFNNTDYKQQQILGIIYLTGLSQLYRLPKPYNYIITMAFDIGHFYGAYTWRDTGYLKHPIYLTLMRVEW